ncbi:MAG: lipocalin family protein [Acidobacteriota bacterium]
MSRQSRYALSAGLVILWSVSLSAQNITGTWKRTAMVIEKSDGSKSDSYPRQLKVNPCVATITYSYTADGKLTTNAPDCGRMKEAIESQNGKTTWRQNGSRVSISSSDVSLPAQLHVVSVDGNTMTWVLTYADNPKIPNPTNAKTLTTVYKRQ